MVADISVTAAEHIDLVVDESLLAVQIEQSGPRLIAIARIQRIFCHFEQLSLGFFCLARLVEGFGQAQRDVGVTRLEASRLSQCVDVG